MIVKVLMLSCKYDHPRSWADDTLQQVESYHNLCIEHFPKMCYWCLPVKVTVAQVGLYSSLAPWMKALTH